jgi:hypothetical protein
MISRLLGVSTTEPDLWAISLSLSGLKKTGKTLQSIGHPSQGVYIIQATQRLTSLIIKGDGKGLKDFFTVIWR